AGCRSDVRYRPSRTKCRLEELGVAIHRQSARRQAQELLAARVEDDHRRIAVHSQAFRPELRQRHVRLEPPGDALLRDRTERLVLEHAPPQVIAWWTPVRSPQDEERRVALLRFALHVLETAPSPGNHSELLSSITARRLAPGHARG